MSLSFYNTHVANIQEEDSKEQLWITVKSFSKSVQPESGGLG